MTPAQAIALHNQTYASRDAAALLDALAPGCLYEMPLLRTRMVGRHEITEGLRQVDSVPLEPELRRKAYS